MDIYHYRVVVYTHFQHTFMFKQHVKMNFASDDPFNSLIQYSAIFMCVFCQYNYIKMNEQ